MLSHLTWYPEGLGHDTFKRYWQCILTSIQFLYFIVSPLIFSYMSYQDLPFFKVQGSYYSSYKKSNNQISISCIIFLFFNMYIRISGTWEDMAAVVIAVASLQKVYNFTLQLGLLWVALSLHICGFSLCTLVSYNSQKTKWNNKQADWYI